MGYPSSIYSDDDGPFKAHVKEFLNSENINHITTFTHANIAERIMRTLKNGIGDRIRGNDKNWYDMLKPVIVKYSNTVHSTIEMKPTQAHQDNIRLEVNQNIEFKATYNRTYPNISVGDNVKITFSKYGILEVPKSSHVLSEKSKAQILLLFIVLIPVYGSTIFPPKI